MLSQKHARDGGRKGTNYRSYSKSLLAIQKWESDKRTGVDSGWSCKTFVAFTSIVLIYFEEQHEWLFASRGSSFRAFTKWRNGVGLRITTFVEKITPVSWREERSRAYFR